MQLVVREAVSANYRYTISKHMVVSTLSYLSAIGGNLDRAGKSSFSVPDQIRAWAGGSPLPPMLNFSVRSRGASVWL